MNRQEKTRIYTRHFLLLCVGSAMFFISFNLIISELPNYITTLGGEQYKGWIILLFTLTAMISRPFSGKLVDCVGRKSIMFFGLIVSALCGILYIFTSTLVLFLLLRLVHGFSTGFTPTGVVSYIADITPIERRGEAVGILGMINNVGSALGFAFGSKIANWFSIEIMFLIAGSFAVIAILFFLPLPESLKEKQAFKPKMLIITPNDILDFNIMPAFIVMILGIFTYGVMLTIIPDYSIHLGLSEDNKGLYMMTYILSSIMVRFVAGKLSDIYGRIIVLKVAMWVLILALVLTANATSITMFLIAGFILGLAVGMMSPTIFAWAIDLSDAQNRGKGISTLFIALEIGIGLGAWSAGAVVYGGHSNSNNFTIIFYIAAVTAFLAWFHMQFILKKKYSSS